MKKLKLSSKDPTQQGKNRKGAKKFVDSATVAASAAIIAWAESVPFAEDGDKVSYLLPEDTNPNFDFEGILLAALLLNGGFFMDQNIEGAFRSGALATERDLMQQISSHEHTFMPYNFDSVFQSREYKATLNAYQSSARDSINGVAKDTSARISGLLLLGMSSGKQIQEIIDEIRRQMEIFNSRIDRVVNTTINQGLNQGKMIALGLAATALHVDGVVMHKSALIPTTRPHHAARHNKLYSIEDQNRWWSSGSNRINCYCSIHPVLKL
jgi:uncharacterized protein YoaH (UPF0181 family)